MLLAIALLLAACSGLAPSDDVDRLATARAFPRAHRPVSQAGSLTISSETVRDARREAAIVMDLAQIAPGMTVADIGAGDGYYTTRLAERVSRRGRVLAQDIDARALKRLGARVERERLDNVSIKLGAQDDPRLPANSFDRVLLVRMYHEVSEPYAFLWRLRPALKPGGRVVVFDVDRPTDQHGIAPELLFCEFETTGFRLVQFVRKPEIAGYLAQFEAAGARPEPREIKPCKFVNGQAERN